MVDGWVRAESIGDVDYTVDYVMDPVEHCAHSTSVTYPNKFAVGPDRWWHPGTRPGPSWAGFAGGRFPAAYRELEFPIGAIQSQCVSSAVVWRICICREYK